MHFTYLIPAFAAMALALPFNETEIVKRDSINNCEMSSFENKLSPDAPLIEDCRVIQRNIAGGGTWYLGSAAGFVQMVAYGTCAWGAEARPAPWSSIRIGNQDIIDLIDDSIKQFGYADRVGAAGTVDCQVEARVETRGIDWKLYHT